MKVGVVGLGMGRNHAKGFQQTEGVEMVAICDLDAPRLAAGAAEFGVERTYTDAQEMFDSAGLDAVSIAVPNVYHHSLTLKALAAGLHVLCEKPLAMNVQQAREMRDAAIAAGRTLMVNYSFRYTPASFAIKRAVDNGELGDIYFARSVWHRRDGIPHGGGWFARKELSGGGPIIDLGVHRLDLALWFMGYPAAERVSATTYSQLGQAKAAASGATFSVEDLGVGYIRLQGGATIVLEASWALNQPEKDLMETWLYGTAGGAVQRNVNEGYQL